MGRIKITDNVTQENPRKLRRAQDGTVYEVRRDGWRRLTPKSPSKRERAKARRRLKRKGEESG